MLGLFRQFEHDLVAPGQERAHFLRLQLPVGDPGQVIELFAEGRHVLDVLVLQDIAHQGVVLDLTLLPVLLFQAEIIFLSHSAPSLIPFHDLKSFRASASVPFAIITYPPKFRHH